MRKEAASSYARETHAQRLPERSRPLGREIPIVHRIVNVHYEGQIIRANELINSCGAWEVDLSFPSAHTMF